MLFRSVLQFLPVTGEYGDSSDRDECYWAKAQMWRSTGDEKYLNAASSNLNYLMGCNPLGICYFTGYGTVSPEHPHHRPSIAQNKPMSGILVGGVHPYLEDSAAKAYCSGQPTGKCYVDNQQSFSTNEVTIY